MGRFSLRGNVSKRDQEDMAKEVFRQMSAVPTLRSAAIPAPPAPAISGRDVEHETVSYNLPVELIELVRELAEARVKVARDEKRKAKSQGKRGPDARRSASAIIREALDAYRPHIEAEIKTLKG